MMAVVGAAGAARAPPEPPLANADWKTPCSSVA
jgi:hypothetical protein